ncbi:putative L,D-transpeptidase ErfK/SrfK precursor [Pelagimonas phthalicica]|uniref:Putative L,D-transpeptidase ErfK/SrfK n=1 Tax=Pelagimonas phthalicica TaxID=1037362 RepID=A0A238J6I6_9RHOB|nr:MULTISPECIES: L,D-transpeptidase [Roseobacteraceae]MBO9463799.1 L,D-transpeptidase [Tropicibacter sp. R15_0]TDS95277.1 L,D-transpeptidase-like protein [Pelagimonas phthalicica]SMX26199.1 putative L,D-transpeptidase ErfK/SrfK precursor [Pelagimonas phthalicica]
MTKSAGQQFNRRAFLAGTAAVLGAPALAQSVDGQETVEIERDISTVVRRNISSFRTLDWQPHFSNLNNGAILVDITSRALHYWEESGAYHLFPSSVPLTEDLTRRGRTKVIRKVEGPSWRPTPSMRKRNPEWPDFVGPGPDNPLGTHALYLSWQYYRIHGTHDTRKIGRRSSNGCIGLYNEHIAQLFAMTKVGTQVLLI